MRFRVATLQSWGVLLGAAVVLRPACSFAHGMVALGDFYGGLLHPFVHLETALPLMAVALWAAQQGAPACWWLVGALMVATGAGATAGLWAGTISPDLPLSTGLMLLSGLAVATAYRTRPAIAAMLVAAAGLMAGWVATGGAGEDVRRPVLWVLGAAAGAGLLAFHVADQLDRWRAFWLDVAVRVLGSWIAAVGLLVGALRLARGRIS